MPYLSTPRLTVHYRAQGNPDGMPVLFVHGSFASSRWWMPLLEFLPEAFYAVALDLRGCGQSDKPDAGYSIAEQVDDLDAFIMGIGLSNFDLVAHASGGAIAMEYALRRPDGPRTLILVDSAPIEGVHTPLEGLILLDQMKNNPGLLRHALASLMPTRDVSNDPFFESLVADAMEMAPAAYTEIAVSLNQWNRFADARKLTLPCLVVWGDQDPIVERSAMTRTFIAIPGAANMEVLRNVGHCPMIEAPLALAERIVDFLAEDFTGYDEIRRAVETE